MSPQMIEAVRKQAFVQGFLRACAKSNNKLLRDYADEEILALLPLADEAYRAYRAECAGTRHSDEGWTP